MVIRSSFGPLTVLVANSQNARFGPENAGKHHAITKAPRTRREIVTYSIILFHLRAFALARTCLFAPQRPLSRSFGAALPEPFILSFSLPPLVPARSSHTRSQDTAQPVLHWFRSPRLLGARITREKHASAATAARRAASPQTTHAAQEAPQHRGRTAATSTQHHIRIHTRG